MKVYSRMGAVTLIVAAAIFAGPISAIFAGSAQAQLLGGDGVTVPGVGDVTVPGSGSTVGSNSYGVPDVALVTTSPNSGGGSNVGLGLLGGGSNGFNVPAGNNNAGVNLPGVGGINGTNGTNGTNGAPGTGGPNFVLLGSANSPGALGPNGGSSKLRTLLNVMQNRAWLRFVAGNAICLPSYGVANIQGWLPQKDWAQLQQVVASYAQDIYTLRTMLSKCRSGGAKLSQADLNRVIGVDIGSSGQAVLFML